MIYIKRDESNNITEINLEPTENFIKGSFFDEDVKTFINENNEMVKDIILELDLGMARVIEDLINTLIEKQILLFTDLPDAVQNKLNFKRMLRDQLYNQNSNDIYEEELLKL